MPLIPSTPPKNPWEKLAADHWGPTPDRKYILFLIDTLTRYPEVAIVSSTGAGANIAAFDQIFSRHGYCSLLLIDNGPPFNGSGSHDLQQYVKWAGIKHHPNRSAEDPEATGLVESFMKCIKMIWHTSIIEHHNPYEEFNKHLLMFHSTPHSTTRASPAELFFGRKLGTRLQLLSPDSANQTMQDKTIINDWEGKTTKSIAKIPKPM